jgi:hypothetical protein
MSSWPTTARRISPVVFESVRPATWAELVAMGLNEATMVGHPQA